MMLRLTSDGGNQVLELLEVCPGRSSSSGLFRVNEAGWRLMKLSHISKNPAVAYS